MPGRANSSRRAMMRLVPQGEAEQKVKIYVSEKFIKIHVTGVRDLPFDNREQHG